MQEKGDAEVCPYCGYREGTPPLAPHYLRPGTVLAGKYLVGRGLGHGGFGTTYIARDQVLGIKLAIKEYLPQDCASRAPGSNMVVPFSGDGAKRFADGLESFLQEARTLARFDGSPNIVGVRDFFTENGTAYLVMNYLEGITLKQYLVRSGGKPVPFEKMLGILLPVMDALRTVHAAGLLHRDVSPDNIFLTTSGQVTLIDFGAARQSMNLNVQNVQQQSVSVILKPGYAPEEQYSSHGNQGPWTDVYAMAATMYHSLTGVVPPTAVDRMQGEPVNWALLETGGVPNHVIAALQNAMKLNARERTQTMAELLSQCQSKSAHASRPGANHSGSRKKANAVVIGLAVALCAMTAVLVTLFVKAKPEPQPAPTKTVVQAEPTVSHVEPTIAYTKPTAPSSNPTKPTASIVPEETQAKKPAVNVNDIVSFGHYEQDGNRSNGAEAIEWLVLDVQGNKALLLSRYALDAQPFHKKYEYVTWDTSTIRQWLNGTFYNSAFSEDEKTIMERTTLLPDRNPYIKCDSGRETADYVFLLSLEEVDAFIQSNGNIDKDALLCYPTDYAVQQGTYKNKDTGGCWWWLRTSADDNLAVCSVNSDTIIDYHDGTVNSPKAGVRPAIWVSIG